MGSNGVEQATFNLRGLSLVLAMPTSRPLEPEVVESLLSTQRVLDTKGIPFDIKFLARCPLIEMARSRLAWDCMNSGANRVLWVDSDQTWTPEQVIRLLCLSTEFDIIGCVYREKRDPPTFAVATKEKELAAGKYGCMKVDGMGMGFVMMNTLVLQRVASQSPMARFRNSIDLLPHMFRCRVDEDNNFVGEDIGFFADCRKAGFEVWVDPGMPIGHIGVKNYIGSMRDLSTDAIPVRKEGR